MKLQLENGPIWALGMMSGTSLDGVDAAFVETDGRQISSFGPHGFTAYSDDDRATLQNALGHWHDAPQVVPAAEVVETAHARLAARLMKAETPALLGFHGQTFAHDPHGLGTHQAGDGKLLATVLGVPVVWDFRAADVEMGGEGAPLVPFFHHACAQFIGAQDPLAVLNLGGVGNITWVDPRVEAPEQTGACLAFDTGPASAPINDLMQARKGQALDEGGALALSGEADEDIIEAFLSHAYFLRVPPKSLDRDQFSELAKSVDTLSDADAARTLTACAAAAVARGMEHCPNPPTRVLVTGGGRHNATMMEELRTRLSVPVEDIDTTGLNGDMLEAQAFAYLAVRVARGLPTSAPSTTGVAAAVGGGVVSVPSPAERVVR